MKRFIFIFSILLVGLGAFVYSMQQPQEYIFQFDAGEIKLTPQQMQDLLEISATFKDMFTNPQGNVALPTDPVHLMEVPRVDFDFIIKNLEYIKDLKESRLKGTLSNLNYNQLASIIETANFLDIPFLLATAIKIYAQRFAFNDTSITKNLGLNQSPEQGKQTFKHYVETLPFSAEMSNQIAQDLQTQAPITWGQLIDRYKETQPTVKIEETEYEHRIYSIAWISPIKLVRAGSDEKIILWNVSNGQKIEEKDARDYWEDLVDWEDQITDVVEWSPDHTKILVAGREGEGAVEEPIVVVWDLVNNKLLHQLQGHTKEITTAQWSPDGKKVATQAEDIIIIWDAQTGHKINQFKGAFFTWSPDSSKLATSFKETISLVDVASGNLLLTFNTDLFVDSLAWSPDSTKIAVGLENIIEIRDAKTGKQLEKISLAFGGFKNQPRPQFIQWNPNNKWIATTANYIEELHKGLIHLSNRFFIDSVQILNVETGRLIDRYYFKNDTPAVLAWNPEGNKLAISSDSGKVVIWTPLDPIFTKELGQLSLPQIQLLIYMSDHKIQNFTQLPEYLWELFNSLPSEIRNLYIQEMEVPEEEYKEGMEIVETFEKEEVEEPAAKRQKTEE